MTAEDAVGHWLASAGRVPLLTAAEELHLGAMVRAWQDHPGGPDQAPPRIIRRGRRARDRIVAANLRLVAHVVRLMRPGLRSVNESDVADLLQAGAIGLVRGAERFDPTRGYKFSTYGYWWIRQGVARWVDGCSRAIRPPSTHASRLARLGRVGASLTAELGRMPTRAELATALGLSVADMDLAMSVGLPCWSLDAQIPGGEDRSSLLELLPARATEPDEQVTELRARVQRLPPHIAALVRDCWGLDGQPLRIGLAAEAVGLTIHQAKRALQLAELQLRTGENQAFPESTNQLSIDGTNLQSDEPHTDS